LLLETKKLTKKFGGVYAVNGLELCIEDGEIVGLIGPNGAGKTTVFNLITGYVEPTEGQIFFGSKDIVGSKPHSIAKLGIGRTFQIAKLFSNLSVIENLLAASHLYIRTSIWETVSRTSKFKNNEAKGLNLAMENMRFLGLEPFKDEIAGTLPHAHQKLLGVAIALATKPKLLLLDEPMEGMNRKEVDKTLELIEGIRANGITIVLIEHNMRAVMRICDRIVVLNFGEEIAKGTPEEVKQNIHVIEAYLGASQNDQLS
jgi:branched-chain amino acid transport system ATP-binding protein